jgi:hypothetical protein
METLMEPATWTDPTRSALSTRALYEQLDQAIEANPALDSVPARVSAQAATDPEGTELLIRGELVGDEVNLCAVPHRVDDVLPRRYGTFGQLRQLLADCMKEGISGDAPVSLAVYAVGENWMPCEEGLLVTAFDWDYAPAPYLVAVRHPSSRRTGPVPQCTAPESHTNPVPVAVLAQHAQWAMKNMTSGKYRLSDHAADLAAFGELVTSESVAAARIEAQMRAQMAGLFPAPAMLGKVSQATQLLTIAGELLTEAAGHSAFYSAELDHLVDDPDEADTDPAGAAR